MSFIYSNNEKSWTAPKSADSINNPLKGNELASAEGKKTYKQLCAICHGNKGKGDGVAGGGLNPKPANFWKEKIQLQTDGAIYWKLTNGKPPMASYKASLSDKKRWQLVNYIRTFSKNKPKATTIPFTPKESTEQKELRLKMESENKFNQLIKDGDVALTNTKLEEAKLKYSEALSIKAQDSTTIYKMDKLQIKIENKAKRAAFKKELKDELKTELKKELIDEIIQQLKDSVN